MLAYLLLPFSNECYIQEQRFMVELISLIQCFSMPFNNTTLFTEALF